MTWAHDLLQFKAYDIYVLMKCFKFVFPSNHDDISIFMFITVFNCLTKCAQLLSSYVFPLLIFLLMSLCRSIAALDTLHGFVWFHFFLYLKESASWLWSYSYKPILFTRLIVLCVFAYSSSLYWSGLLCSAQEAVPLLWIIGNAYLLHGSPLLEYGIGAILLFPCILSVLQCANTVRLVLRLHLGCVVTEIWKKHCKRAIAFPTEPAFASNFLIVPSDLCVRVFSLIICTTSTQFWRSTTSNWTKEVRRCT
jgi:hypothetical protein